ncbi:P-loop containing nucleoside triphosphate hydrolase protein [Violaceomyces palustris]|uniref:P-loop containing nucleoside triphosphate hydrolase protein n=1 Tax=Violaceomyces palustris TaxID=1673888 RepID=A0ACD0P349_9BASI|nr:P-loop containing nucleoside triphosphate hydrolase protein [Violaceomyces palustris]
MIEKPLSLTWSDLGYAVEQKEGALFRKKPIANSADGKLNLIQNASGTVKGGEMVAIMGPSGAGKSTFLDIISGRKKPTRGTVNLCSIEFKDVKSISSYVEQDDALLGVLTVRETFWYSAKLSLPPSTTAKEIDERVETIIKGLGLSHVANNRIGTPIQRGISGGQKRRVTIGCSLVTLPRILFLDECTSGLDIATAYEVVKAIKNLALKHNIAILATIHSPNWEIFRLFDRTILLAKGKTIYSGTIDGVVPYFDELGYPCPKHTNPADHMMSLVSTDFLSPCDDDDLHYVEEGKARNGLANVEAFAEHWKKRQATTSGAEQLQLQLQPHGSHSIDEGATKSVCSTQPEATGGASNAKKLFSQTLTLTKRNFLNYSRNLLAYGVRLGMYVGMGVLLATVWVNLAETDTKINDRLSVHFFSCAFLGFMSVAGIPSFLEERLVLKRERGNNLYGPAPFVLANTLVTVPFLFICTLVFSLICYWSIGLHGGADYYFRFLAFLYLGVYAAECQSLLVAAFLPIFVAALAIAAFLNGFWMCVQGYFIRAVNLPAFWYYWAHFIDYQTFTFDILVKNDLKGIIFKCSGEIADNTCSCSFPSSLIEQGQCAVSGEDVLRALDIDGVSTTLYAFILVLIIVVYRVCFYLVLKFKG